MNYVDDSDTMTPADEASWLELVRVAPFKKAWSEEDGWTWTSPHANLIEGECDGVRVEVVPSLTAKSEWMARVVGETCSFLGSTSLSAMKALMVCDLFS